MAAQLVQRRLVSFRSRLDIPGHQRFDAASNTFFKIFATEPDGKNQVTTAVNRNSVATRYRASMAARGRPKARVRNPALLPRRTAQKKRHMSSRKSKPAQPGEALSGRKGRGRPPGRHVGSKNKKQVDSYRIYIFRVLKQVHPQVGISSRAMGIMNSFVNDIFEKLAAEAAKLANYNRKTTMKSREVQNAVRLVLPGELANHAISEGNKAVAKFSSPCEL